MKTEMKYRARRLVAAIIILVIFIIFTTSVIVKGIDNELDRRDRVLVEHLEVWE